MPQHTTRRRLHGYRRHSRTLAREPESAATARRLVRVALADWGLDDLADDSTVVVSELVTNAIQHARRESIRVTIERADAACVRVGVVDFSRERPVNRESSFEDDGGRGLALVGELADAWGTELLPWGKRVWADLKEQG
ncbi:ATP-binding protein [Streptomyces sp. WAC 06738]|uniref:ATP-binding protein n=1 Tax=Streptomyces sp. WAC 06738 TaxID=2203210 RepID=UPI000F71B42B|nr:ATP-binding protein [Streptomyces sp. WAC 06738]AZM47149.1 ATP-binding protein [Streptomyces sp. WAC 06738]